MTLDELLPILAAYRAQVQPAWTVETAHPGYDAAPGSPVGQCGVTSAWLQERLEEDHGIGTTYWTGVLYAASKDATVQHCWLELDTTDIDVIVDITADQVPALAHLPVICDAYGVLLRQGIDYNRQRSLTPEQLAADPIQDRLRLLRLELDTQARTEWVRSHRVEGGT